MSSDDQEREHAATKAELAYLRNEIVALWRALAQVQTQIAQIHQDRIKDLLRSETVIDAAKLN
jgi:hypothetical protein